MKMKGIVYIEQTQQPVPGVNVSLVDKSTHKTLANSPVVQSDVNGNYSIELPEGDVCNNILVAFKKSGFTSLGIVPKENLDVYIKPTAAIQPSPNQNTGAVSATGVQSTMVELPKPEKDNKRIYIIAAITFVLIVVAVFAYVKMKKTGNAVTTTIA